MKLSIACTLALIANMALAQTFYKHDIDWISRHMGTKTTYLEGPANDSIVKDYDVLQVQLVKRHGTRYPTDGDTKGIATIIDVLKQSKKRPNWLKDYKNEFLPRRAGALNLVGQLEEYTHGRRMASNYPDLLKEVIDNDVLLHMSAFSSYSERTSQSSVAFQMGLLEGRGSVGSPHHLPMPALNYPEIGDHFISIDDNCPAWENREFNVDAESDAYLELAGTPIAKRLSKELGVNLTTKHFSMIYTACTFDVAHHKRVDTFCSLLSREDVLVGEFVEDLSYFYKYGHGDAINSQVACVLARDIFGRIEGVVNSTSSDYERLGLKFGHTQTITLLQSFLGLFREDIFLRANSTQSIIENRIFKTSDNNNFASNVAFQVLQKKKNSDRNFYVRILVNEKPVVLPGCDVEVCPYEKFKAVLAPRLVCNYDEICGVA